MCQTLVREHDTVRVQSHINESPHEIAAVERAFPWALGLSRRLRAVLADRRARRCWPTTSIRPRPSSIAWPSAGHRSRTARRATPRSAAASFRFGVTSTPACTWRSAPMSAAASASACLKEALCAHLMQRVAPQPLVLDARRMLYLATLAGAKALGLDGEIGSFCSGKAADFVYLRPPTEACSSPCCSGPPAPSTCSGLSSRWLEPKACARSASMARLCIGHDARRAEHVRSARLRAALGWIFEDSPWVAERAWDRRPFASVAALHAAMADVVDSATENERLALLRAHPDLGTRARMSDASVGEQQGAGLDRLTGSELEQLQQLNAAYQSRFGFPFLLAVKGSTKHDVLTALARRSAAEPGAELMEALGRCSGLPGSDWRNSSVDEEAVRSQESGIGNQDSDSFFRGGPREHVCERTKDSLLRQGRRHRLSAASRGERVRPGQSRSSAPTC